MPLTPDEMATALRDAANKWVSTHDGTQETSCGLVGLARQAADLITRQAQEIAELKQSAQNWHIQPPNQKPGEDKIYEF